jgi:hypothetical protein
MCDTPKKLIARMLNTTIAEIQTAKYRNLVILDAVFFFEFISNYSIYIGVGF